MLWQNSMACLDPCWSLQALVFQEEVGACGIYLSLELAMTIRNWDLCSPLLLAIVWRALVQICGRTVCCLKWISCWWNAPHGQTAENIFCLCTEQVCDGRSTSCLWAFLGSAWGCVWEETLWAELAEMHHTLKPSRNEVIILQIKINMFILVGKKTLLTEKINFHMSLWISDKYLCY